ncbi:MAG: hypothetical protein PHY41_00775 [Candidatus Cloacimonetes bacterium]|jgi:hypothetical protein|nr:hypothetical protein [Candidatus Cloacimonadota bacterium]MDY0298369.1 hypothetical protein [Candidatus Cloacimonadaceae bacterium]MCB5278020.1 hypothetical protein [Candidatus Cloacimonadota bacterium]MCK9332816.1 hypothetical protein [Candidatus Cloacimonadota bacterium]MDD2209891.1 hypothetical protein [Candidatus Cloacimonadota bacterium]
MLTIDWKERLTQDTEDYLKNKLPNQDYDFEIIFIAYPERVNGKIPSEVISFVSAVIVKRLGRKHKDYIPFYKHLWLKKGDYGKLAFNTILAKLTNKNPGTYIPLIEEMIEFADGSQINALLDRVMLPLLRKYPDKYITKLYAWSKDRNPDLAKASINLCMKLIKRREDLIQQILNHLQNHWVYPLGDLQPLHTQFLKTVAKLSRETYLDVWKEFGISRDPQIVELLSASITNYDESLEAPIEIWAKSGNARVKKAGLAAQKTLSRKKGTKA